MLQAGAAFVGLDPAFPDEHLRSVLEDAGAVALLTDAAGRQRVLAAGIPVPPILRSDGLPPACNAHAVGHADPHSLAYAIYTSGTTGKPKGVLIEHRGIVNLVTSERRIFRPDVRRSDRPVLVARVRFVHRGDWLAFAVGATLVPLDDETVRLGPDLVPWLQRERVTVLCPPPTLLRTMNCADPQRELPDLRLLYVGGEALSADLADRWSAGRWMENGYGPTECTVTVVRGRVRPGQPVTIGKPVRGHRAWVLDDALQEVPDGQAGELCVGGVGLAGGTTGATN